MSAKDEKKQIDTSDKKDDAKEKANDVKKDDKGNPLSESDIKLFRRYCKGPYSEPLKKVEEEIKSLNQKIVNLQGIKESDTGLSLPTQWNIEGDRAL